MKEYTIKRISVSNKDKNGNELKTRNGKPFLKVGLQVAEYGETWINGLWFGADCPWKEGMVVELIISEEEFNGRKQMKFEIPKKEDKDANFKEQVLNTLAKHTLLLQEIKKALAPDEKSESLPPLPEVEEDIDPASIPF